MIGSNVRSLVIVPPLSAACRAGQHGGPCARTLWTRCACSCHHGRTVDGQCATHGCDCTMHEAHPGLPFSRRYATSYRVTPRGAS